MNKKRFLTSCTLSAPNIPPQTHKPPLPAPPKGARTGPQAMQWGHLRGGAEVISAVALRAREALPPTPNAARSMVPATKFVRTIFFLLIRGLQIPCRKSSHHCSQQTSRFFSRFFCYFGANARGVLENGFILFDEFAKNLSSPESVAHVSFQLIPRTMGVKLLPRASSHV